MSEVLQCGPPIAPRRETVPCPELGGSVICRGLLASELFSVEATRSQAMRRVREARRQYEAEVAEQLRADPEAKPAPFEPPELDANELRQYGRYISQMLAWGVVTRNGMALYSADDWEVASQHYPGMVPRLQAIVERLSGLDAEDVRKNSPPSPT